eukprot:2212194-Pyramimonas_sp.AAC.1
MEEAWARSKLPGCIAPNARGVGGGGSDEDHKSQSSLSWCVARALRVSGRTCGGCSARGAKPSGVACITSHQYLSAGIRPPSTCGNK